MTPLASGDLALYPTVVGAVGGLAVFLFGLQQLTGALRALAGGGLQRVLSSLTRNPLAAAATGFGVTAVVQASSVTTVLVVGFVSAGQVTLQQAVGVILGANVGTTVTAQVIAFRVTDHALLLVATGFFGLFVARRARARNLGELVMGLGMTFLGMALMASATAPLRTYDPFVDALARMGSGVPAILVAAAFTALVQSSSATTGIVIVLAGQGFISLETGIAMVLGANLGTCVTAVLAALGKGRVALRTALVHVLFNAIGVLLWAGLVGLLADLVRRTSPSRPDLAGAVRVAAEVPRQLANAHTVFNLANMLLFLPFTGWLAGLATRLVPDRPGAEPDRAAPRHLDPAYLGTPRLAVERLRLEVGHLGDLAVDAVRAIGPTEGRDPAVQRGAFFVTVREVRGLFDAILAYARRILSQPNVTEEDSLRLQGLLAAATDLHQILDGVSQDLEPVASEWASRRLEGSRETRALFADLHAKVLRALERSVAAVAAADQAIAEEVLGMKPAIRASYDALGRRLAGRLAAEGADRVAVYRLESEIVGILDRFARVARRIAHGVVAAPQAAEGAGGGRLPV